MYPFAVVVVFVSGGVVSELWLTVVPGKTYRVLFWPNVIWLAAVA